MTDEKRPVFTRIKDANPRPSGCTCGDQRKWKRAGRPPSRALIVARGGAVHVLDSIGPDVDWEMENVGASEFLRGWDEDGVFVWSGHIHGWRDYHGEYDSEMLTDDSRPPTEEEWREWCSFGEVPWTEGAAAYYEPELPCPVHRYCVCATEGTECVLHPPRPTVDCGACGATVYEEDGGVRSPVAGRCGGCGGVSLFERCDECAPDARRFVNEGKSKGGGDGQA